MSHKEIWNMIIHSRDVWPMEHLFHNLDIMLYAVLASLIGLAIIGYHEWKFCRGCRENRFEYRQWLRQWRATQKKGHINASVDR
jgi:hypothetical protein